MEEKSLYSLLLQVVETLKDCQITKDIDTRKLRITQCDKVLTSSEKELMKWDSPIPIVDTRIFEKVKSKRKREEALKDIKKKYHEEKEIHMKELKVLIEAREQLVKNFLEQATLPL